MKQLRSKTREDIDAVKPIQDQMGGLPDGPKPGGKWVGGVFVPCQIPYGEPGWYGTDAIHKVKFEEATSDFTLDLIADVDEAIDAADLVPEGERTEKEAKLAKVKKDKSLKVEDDEQ